MKKIKVMAMLLCVAALGLTTSCTKNEDLIVGKWKCIYSEGAVNPVSEVIDVQYEFTAGGKLKMTQNGQTATVAKYKVADDQLTIGEGKKAVKSTIAVLTERAMKITRGVDKSDSTYAIADYQRL